MAYTNYSVETAAPCYAGEDIFRGAIITVKEVDDEEVVMIARSGDNPMGVAIYGAREGTLIDRAIGGTVNTAIAGDAVVAVGDWVVFDDEGLAAEGTEGFIIGQVTTKSSGDLGPDDIVRVTVNLNMAPASTAGP